MFSAYNSHIEVGITSSGEMPEATQPVQSDGMNKSAIETYADEQESLVSEHLSTFIPARKLQAGEAAGGCYARCFP